MKRELSTRLYAAVCIDLYCFGILLTFLATIAYTVIGVMKLRVKKL
ncbi:MAG: hypothetical protein ACLTE2_03335 [Eubacteriales bacterium]